MLAAVSSVDVADLVSASKDAFRVLATAANSPLIFDAAGWRADRHDGCRLRRLSPRIEVAPTSAPSRTEGHPILDGIDKFVQIR